MRKIKILFGFLMILAVSACTDFVDPAIPYNNFVTGTYLRTLSVTPNFNFFELSTAKFSLTVEAVDELDGKKVKDVEILVRRRRGQSLSPEKSVKTFGATEFKPQANSKYPAATLEVTAAEALTAMGFTTADITGGDFFEFRIVLTTTDGFTFSNNNLSGDIAGGAYYRSPFFYRVPVICPSNLAGTYDVSTVGWCGDTYTGKAKFVAGATAGTYTVEVDLDGTFVEDFSFGFYRACYGASTAPPAGGSGLRFTDACGQVGFNSAGSSPWGDQFFLDEVTVNGAVLTLKVRTSYPPEAGTVTLTRTDGTNWPPLRL